MTDKKPAADNFDKEFSLNSKKKPAVRGKVPSWIMILAGVAVMAAVVIVKQPFVRPSDRGTRAAVTIPGTGTGVSGQTAAYSGINDQQADPSELEARFGDQSGIKTQVGADIPVIFAGSDQPYSMLWKELETDKSGEIIPYESDEEDSSIYWVDETPFEVVLKPAEKTDVKDSSSVVTINDQEYSVSLEQLTQDEITALPEEKLSELIRIGEDTYMIRLAPKGGSETAAVTEEPAAEQDPKAEIAPDEDPFAEKQEPETVQTEPDAPAVAWLNEKPFSVTVRMYEEPAQEAGEEETAAQKAYFEADGEMYEVSLREMDSKEAEKESAADPVVWIDRTPLKVSLQEGAAAGSPVEVVLDPVPEEDLPALLKERFGEDAAAEDPKPEDPQTGSEEPVSEPTEVPQEEGWFAGLFHNIFGGGPTAEPTPQVTVIAVTPTPAPKLPTATAIVVRMAPTSTPQSPVRLDPDGQKAVQRTPANTLAPKGGDMNDPALWDIAEATATPAGRASTSGQNRGRATQTATPSADSPAALNQPDTIIVEPSDNGTPVQVTAEPTPGELPHTGMADGWNIPSMVCLLAGLLLIIIGVRRLRANRG